MKPKFTARFVFHWMGISGTPPQQADFEELSGGVQHDRVYERYGTAYDDDCEFVSDAVLIALLDDEKNTALLATLKPGGYLMVLAAGTLDYHTYTDWESGGTECDLDVDVEWYTARVMSDEERRFHDHDNELLPAGVPLALITERSPWEFEFKQSPETDLYAIIAAPQPLGDLGLVSATLAVNGDVLSTGYLAKVPFVETRHTVVPGEPYVIDIPTTPDMFAGDPVQPPPTPTLMRCAADRDGECVHAQCPQLRDNEPAKSRRHCPLDIREELD
jgi:hypothetical protein